MIVQCEDKSLIAHSLAALLRYEQYLTHSHGYMGTKMLTHTLTHTHHGLPIPLQTTRCGLWVVQYHANNQGDSVLPLLSYVSCVPDLFYTYIFNSTSLLFVIFQ